MAARDYYTSKVKCPSCDQEGVLHISEDNHPYMYKQKPYVIVEKVEGNFEASVDERKIKVICKNCQTEFKI